MVEHLLIVQWVVILYPQGGPIELYLVQTSAPQLVLQRPWYLLFCLSMVHIKYPLLLVQGETL